MDVVTYRYARDNFVDLVERVINDKVETVVVRKDNKAVVIVDKREWDSIHETLYLLSSPNNAARLLKSVAELR